MSICQSGMVSKVEGQILAIRIDNVHPLLMLANKLDWESVAKQVLPDLQATTKKKKWWLGRPLRLRMHLGVYLLQQLLNKTDRQMESELRENAAYQLFCGREIIKKWHIPDHTKIEEFRSRLSPETQQQLANLICKLALKKGFAEVKNMDIDSTVQEANMTYPTDAKMLRKLGCIALTVASGLKKILSCTKQDIAELHVDIKTIASKARQCFFLNKKATKEQKSTVLGELLAVVSEPILRISAVCNGLSEDLKKQLPWHIKRAMNQLLLHAQPYLESVKSFIITGEAEMNKRLSFHLNEVACFNNKCVPIFN